MVKVHLTRDKTWLTFVHDVLFRDKTWLIFVHEVLFRDKTWLTFVHDVLFRDKTWLTFVHNVLFRDKTWLTFVHDVLFRDKTWLTFVHDVLFRDKTWLTFFQDMLFRVGTPNCLRTHTKTKVDRYRSKFWKFWHPTHWLKFAINHTQMNIKEKIVSSLQICPSFVCVNFLLLCICGGNDWVQTNFRWFRDPVLLPKILRCPLASKQSLVIPRNTARMTDKRPNFITV